tara:strand:- start:669 stop:1127 length:459 start_codon:yes stop_codon:yes gene_type:complete
MKEIIDIYAAKDTVPPSSAFTPTVTSTLTQYTLSTADTTLRAGYWLYDASQNEVRKIKTVKTTTRGVLEEAFSVNLSATTVKVITDQEAKLVKLSVAADNGGAISINGEAIASGSSINWETSPADQASGARFLEPKVVDGATNSATVSYTTF